MTKRRSLVSGLKGPDKTDPKQEEAFVFGKKDTSRPTAKKKPATKPVPELEPLTPAAPDVSEPTVNVPTGRSPLTTRLRSDLGEALKRASLERQLAKQTPNTVQDILEEALEPWLKDHGYLR